MVCDTLLEVGKGLVMVRNLHRLISVGAHRGIIKAGKTRKRTEAQVDNEDK